MAGWAEHQRATTRPRLVPIVETIPRGAALHATAGFGVARLPSSRERENGCQRVAREAPLRLLMMRAHVAWARRWAPWLLLALLLLLAALGAESWGLRPDGAWGL
jgi:hypothetical protein